jgi:phosphoribosylformylglycinamidine synthase
MKFGVVIFPGSNCDHDVLYVLSNLMKQEVVELWHKERSLPGIVDCDCIVLPGGFAFGDYLRVGAIARFSAIMDAVIEFAQAGGHVWGIGNGFQVLCEAGLLPGTLLRNDRQRFICRNVWIKAVTKNSPLTANLDIRKTLKIPIAHAEGRYYADPNTLHQLIENDQILFKYCTPAGETAPDSNPNGSLQNIAGICNEGRNVFGLMPHPERAAEAILRNTDGRLLFESLLASVPVAGVLI